MIAKNNFTHPVWVLCLLALATAASAFAGPPSTGTTSTASASTASASKRPETSGWLTSLDAAVAAAQDGDRYLLVDLYADWCGWCKTLEKDVFTSAEFREYTKNMVLLRVDTEDGGEGSELQGRFGASGLPTTLILTADMVKVGAVKGYAPTVQFIAKIQEQIAAYDALLDLYGTAQRSDNVALMRQLAKDFHGRGDGQHAAALYEAVLATTALEGQPDDDAAWLHYLAADAHRLSGDFATAEQRWQRANQLAAAGHDAKLGERLGMLRYYIAFDSGDCGGATASLERFLTSHPESGLRTQARRTLDALRRGESMECT